MQFKELQQTIRLGDLRGSVNSHSEFHEALTATFSLFLRPNSACYLMSILRCDIVLKQIERRDGVVVGASASQLVDLGFIPLVESYQKT